MRVICASVALLALGIAPAPAGAQNQLPDWTTTVDGLFSDADEAAAVAVDAAGDVIAAGLVFDATTGPSFYVTKLSGATGAEIWHKNLGTGGALAVAVDAAGDVLAAGSVPGAMVDSDFMVVKLAGGNGDELWRETIDGPDGLDDVAVSVAVDPNDDVIAAGFSTSVATGADLFVVKLSGATGDPVWTGLVDGTAGGNDEATQVVVDAAGHVIASGLLRDSVTQSDFAVVKFLPEPSPALLLAGGIAGMTALAWLREKRNERRSNQ
jgi:hypothetical protein